MIVTFVRTLILYILVVLVMRVMGKRQIGQLQPFELVVAIMISELAAVPMQNTGIPLINGIIPIITLLIAQLIFSLFSIKSIKAREIICGKPRILIRDGKIIENNLRDELYTVNDLQEQLRNNSVMSVEDVELAILETNGQLSIYLKSDKRPVTVGDLKINVIDNGIPTDVIVDGRILTKNLLKLGFDEKWLIQNLEKLGIKNPSNVFIAIADKSGKLFVQNKQNAKGGS